MQLRKLTKVVAVVTTASLVTFGAVITANAAQVGPDATVGIEVEIEAPGELYMEVAAGDLVLTENGSDDDARRFNGQLPNVTVTDTRKAAEMPADPATWYVLGTASDIATTDGDTIPAANFGWEPQEVDYDGYADILTGDPVEPDFEGAGPGLVGQELLFADWSTAFGDPHAPAGVYTATAEVTLHTPTDAAGGTYEGSLTLSLWED